MKNFKLFMVAAVALIAGTAITSCTPDNPVEDTKETKAEVIVDALTPNGATLKVVTNNIKEFAYMVDPTNENAPTSAILQAGEKTAIEDPTVEKTTTISLQGFEASSSHKAIFAFRQADGIIYKERVVVDFTTTSYGDNVLTVVEQRYDGFAIHVQVPEEVKERGNALRFSTSSLAMYNYGKQNGSMEIDMLLYNAGQYITEDKTVRYDEYNSYERDEEGNIVENGASYSDAKVPGEPGVFIIGEYAYMDDPDEMIVYMDLDGDGEMEISEVSVPEDDPNFINYAERSIWNYPAGWRAGYYKPMYDWMTWINEAGTDAYDSEKYWTGYYEKIEVKTLEPETLEGNVEISITEKTPMEALITFTPSDDVAQFSYLILTESEYQEQVLPLINYNEEHLRWFTGSYFAYMSFGVSMGQGITDQWLTDWFVDTKGMAGQTLRVLVAGLGDSEGKSQCFNMTTFTLPEVTLPKPEIVVTPVASDDPYLVTFNIKNPNYATNPVNLVKFACNYTREYDAILKQYSYTDLLKQMGNALDATAIEHINSDAGFTFQISSRDNATTRLAVLAYNWEGSSNNPDAVESPAVAEYTTPNASFPVRVNSDLFEKLQGEWVASADMVEYISETDASGNVTGITTKSAGVYTSDVTISAGVEYPATLPEEVYELYAKGGVSREKTNEYWEEFKALADAYNVRTRGFNRLLCVGYDFAAPEYLLDQTATPYELFTAEDYSASQTSYMFYDFGPKWNLEIDADGNVWLPIDIEREFPLETFNMGMDYAFYMLAIGQNSYMGAPIYNQYGQLICDSRFPVEVSADYNTITIKPIVYNYTDANGQAATETFYPCVAQLQYGMATPLNPRVESDVVLVRKGATQAAKANAGVASKSAAAVKSLGKAPVPAQRTESMTPMSIEMMKPVTVAEREMKIEAGAEAFHRRAHELMDKTFGPNNW